MAEKRYLLCPGYVRSRTDGERHWIDSGRLAQLYGVDPAECLIKPPLLYGWVARPELIQLHPRTSGNYTHPEIHVEPASHQQNTETNNEESVP